MDVASATFETTEGVKQCMLVLTKLPELNGSLRMRHERFREINSRVMCFQSRYGLTVPMEFKCVGLLHIL